MLDERGGEVCGVGFDEVVRDSGVGVDVCVAG
jgi:hypothetical protein